MDLKKPVNKEHLLNYKQKVITELDNMLLSDINSGNVGNYKKAANITYWLNDFVKYTKEKENFNARNFIPFKRGQVVKVNLGFNVGREEGGLHYAVVIDKKNSERSDLLTIVPLTSIKFDSQKKIANLNKRFDVLLGTDVARSILDKNNSHLTELMDEKKHFEMGIEKIQEDTYNFFHNRSKKYYIKTRKFSYVGVIKGADKENLLNKKKMILIHYHLKNIKKINTQHAEQLIELKNKMEDINKKREVLKKISSEASKMKGGSIALVGQITTISKQRLFDPKYEDSVLTGIRISAPYMEQINNKIKELYVF